MPAKLPANHREKAAAVSLEGFNPSAELQQPQCILHIHLLGLALPVCLGGLRAVASLWCVWERSSSKRPRTTPRWGSLLCNSTSIRKAFAVMMQLVEVAASLASSRERQASVGFGLRGRIRISGGQNFRLTVNQRARPWVGRLASILDRLSHCHRREWSTGRSYALTSLQNRLTSIISSIEPAAALPMRGSATTTARHLARDNATLTRLRSRMKASPLDPYSP